MHVRLPCAEVKGAQALQSAERRANDSGRFQGIVAGQRAGLGALAKETAIDDSIKR